MTKMTEKLKSMWTPTTIEEKSVIMTKINETSNHRSSNTKLLMGFFNFDGIDIERVKKDYPNTMSEKEKEIVLEYMKNSKIKNRYKGFATSRINGEILGTSDMETPDKKWVFPEKWDTHYIDKFNISPPREFIEDAIKWKNGN